MKTETKHTPGPWWVAYGQVFAGNGIDRQVGILKADRDEPQTSPVERDANVAFAAEAGTVASETGLTPRQLADQRKELLEALQDMEASLIKGPIVTQEHRDFCLHYIRSAISKAVNQ